MYSSARAGVGAGTGHIGTILLVGFLVGGREWLKINASKKKLFPHKEDNLIT